MLRDDDVPYPRVGDMGIQEMNADEELSSQQHANNDFDDVFGSAPSSPSFEHTAVNDALENGNGNVEYSDIPRLKEKHETEGYRDGVTKGKADSVQVGFDEGYGLGAVLGLRIGRILGLLEGIYNAILAGEVTEWEIERGRLENLLAQARRELDTRSVFDKEWWGEDGVWKFEVPGEVEGGEVVFHDIAGAHPLVGKWEVVVDEEVKRWGLDLGIMDGEGDEGVDGKDLGARKDVNSAKEVASEPVAGTGKIMGVEKGDLNW